ncbi:SLOG family protein, partial [Kingella denitrificans]|uniref:SLOG family protein n=1 Tax=Kingella denitrificans TaxID=502 RepID=UPI0034D98046
MNGKNYPPKRFLICGIRKWPYYFPILMIVGGLKKTYGEDIVVIEGEASGVDSFARRAAEDLGLEFDPYPANWKKHGRAA